MSFVRCLILLLSVTISLFAAEKSPGIRLLDAMDFESNFMFTSKAVFKGVFEFMKVEGITAQVMTEISNEADRTFEKTSQDPELKKTVARIYERRFTPDELEELIRFYESPVGRKFIKAMSETSKEEEEIGQKFFEKNAPAFEAKLERIMVKAFEGDAAEEATSEHLEQSERK